MMRNIRLVLAYDGTDFHGWQRQPDAPTVQGTLEAAIEKITREPVRVWGSGRTDAGVHALNQVANFKTCCPIPCENLLKALNGILPASMRVKETRQVAESFHARNDVRSKTYCYRILQSPVCSPFIARYGLHWPFPLDRQRMAEAARLVEGEHDFTSFAGSAGEGLYVPASERHRVGEGLHSPCGVREHHEGAPLEADQKGRGMVRTIFSSRILWRPRTSILVYEVRGSGFLQHMVRNLVGTLMEVGKGKLAPNEVRRILAGRDRRLAGPTAPAHGLCLVRVEY